MMIGLILIFETREEKNSAYIYDVQELKNKSSINEYGKRVLKFFNTFFIENQNSSIRVKDYLALGDRIAPNGSNEYTFHHKKHWRFTHDQNLAWHEKVKNMMRQVHGLTTKSIEESINYA
jgi:hypothetical protein